MEDIDKVKDDDLNYFRLMVRTRLDYAARVLPPLRDTPLEMDALTEMLEKKSKQVFVNEIMHCIPWRTRPSVQDTRPLTPEELYYLVVLSEDEIYTSATWASIPDLPAHEQPNGDSLLLSVHVIISGSSSKWRLL